MVTAGKEQRYPGGHSGADTLIGIVDGKLDRERIGGAGHLADFGYPAIISAVGNHGESDFPFLIHLNLIDGIFGNTDGDFHAGKLKNVKAFLPTRDFIKRIDITIGDRPVGRRPQNGSVQIAFGIIQSCNLKINPAFGGLVIKFCDFHAPLRTGTLLENPLLAIVLCLCFGNIVPGLYEFSLDLIHR